MTKNLNMSFAAMSHLIEELPMSWCMAHTEGRNSLICPVGMPIPTALLIYIHLQSSTDFMSEYIFRTSVNRNLDSTEVVRKNIEKG
jgi:hypothetical protein